MSISSFPERVPQARNLAIFWGATLEGRSQGELATEHGISQQRASQIVRSVRLFLALATSEQFEGVPQEAQLQLGCRIQLEKLSRRRRGVARAWDDSTKPFTSVKRVQTSQGERVETVEKSRYGDWRLDRQLGEIDKQILDTTVLLYERPWVGRGELRISDCGLRIGEERMRNAESGMRNGGGVEAVVGGAGADAAEVVLDTEYSVRSTETAEPAAVEPAEMAPPAAEVVTSHAQSAIRNPQSAIEPTCPGSPFRIPDSEFRIPSPQSAIRNPQSAIAPRPFPAPNPAFRPDPICDLSGEWIKPPSDAHRPWRRVLLPREWLFPAETRGADTPEGVLWDSAGPNAQVGAEDSPELDASALARVPWDEIERRVQARLARAGLAAAP